MSKAKNKQKAIRQKLMAAIAMLMVSAIMVVSSSYAWFTLSTAPEVTGIQTSIGANGNLEMALNNGNIITSNVGDSLEDATVKNVTWGNLVDLSTGYGLDMVQLMPSRLDAAGGVLNQNLLEVPNYGADGRVTDMEDVIQGIYANGTVPSGNGNGVRLFGTSAGMSDEELALRSAKQNFSTYMNAAKGKATSTLTVNGGTLADMAISYGLYADAATFTRTQVEALNSVVTSLEAATTDIETALKYAVKAAATTEAGGHTFDITGSLEDVIAALELLSGEEYTALDTYVTELNELKASVAAAKSTMETALAEPTKDSFVWTDFSGAINALMNSTGLKVNGLGVDAIQSAPGDFANAVMKAGKIEMVVPTGAGVFADIADFTGDYTTPTITIAEINYDTITLTEVPATMKADTTLDASYITVINGVLNGLTASGVNGTASLSDFYAYAIDLAFRTNAADSNLLLQTEAADRIYEDNTLEDTLGGGSYMEFTVATGFKLETAKKLMASIRVVFMSTNDGDASATAPTIYAVAVLDVDNLATTANGTVKVPMKLVEEYSVASGELTISTDASTGKPVFATDDDGEYDATIMGLNQNVQQNLTALVYLDGNTVDNSMVANGDFSLSGHMNLQFASSAELKPMEYTDLHIPAN